MPKLPGVNLSHSMLAKTRACHPENALADLGPSSRPASCLATSLMPELARLEPGGMPFCQPRANFDCFGLLHPPELKLQVA